MRIRTTIYALLDSLAVSIVFALFIYSRAGNFYTAFSNYLYSFLIFLGLWIIISLLSRKYLIHRQRDMGKIIRQILLGNILILGASTTIMFLVRVDYYSRTVVFGTILVTSFIELLWGTLDYYVRTAIIESPLADTQKASRSGQSLRNVLIPKRIQRKDPAFKAREEAVLVEISKEAFDFIFSYAPIESEETMLISTTSRFNIEMQRKEGYKSIVNLRRINDIRYMNKFFEVANKKLPLNGLFVDFVETKNLRKERILKKFPFLLNYVAYFFDFLIKRVFPKFLLTKGLYFFLTRGQNRVITKAETFGRLYSCGFEIIGEEQIANHLFFIARKVSDPHFPENPTYGPFIKLERVAYKGEIITVYKLRTMHPYSEFIQDYIYSKHGTANGDKADNDFRVTSWGKFLRMFWFDELPMLYNLLRGDIKLFGVRPLSRGKYNMYPEYLQEKRILYKPGLVPPFYVDIPQTFQEHMDSEERYLDAYAKHPFKTDFVYFFKAIFNIIFRRARSK